MPAPKSKHSKRRTRIQRNKKYSRDVVQTVKCKNCGADKLAHRVCEECGK